MHAFENGFPNMSVELPTGWSVKNVTLNSPLIVSPFGVMYNLCKVRFMYKFHI